MKYTAKAFAIAAAAIMAAGCSQNKGQDALAAAANSSATSFASGSDTHFPGMAIAFNSSVESSPSAILSSRL